jgi:hypothetical protein
MHGKKVRLKARLIYLPKQRETERVRFAILFI